MWRPRWGRTRRRGGAWPRRRPTSLAMLPMRPSRWRSSAWHPALPSTGSLTTREDAEVRRVVDDDHYDQSRAVGKYDFRLVDVHRLVELSGRREDFPPDDHRSSSFKAASADEIAHGVDDLLRGAVRLQRPLERRPWRMAQSQVQRLERSPLCRGDVLGLPGQTMQPTFTRKCCLFPVSAGVIGDWEDMRDPGVGTDDRR